MKKKVFLLSMVTAGALAIGVAVFAGVDGMSSPSLSYNQTRLGGTYALNLDSTQTPAELTANFQNNVAGTVKTALGNNVKLHFVNARKLEGGFATLASHGKIYNFDGGGQVAAIDGISFEGEGGLIFKPVLAGGILADVDPVVVAPGTEKYNVPVCDYFQIEAADGGANITSLKIYYACDPDAENINLLNGTYTGIGSDSSTYKLVVEDGHASIATLDKKDNFNLSGTAVMLDKDTAKCTFVYNTFNIYYVMDFDGHSFTFVSKSDDVGGAAAAAVAEVNFDRVYNVEDFESYTATGQGYTNSTTKYQTTGLRANYYADYYTDNASDSSEIGGTKWKVMTSTDNTTLLKTKGHNGSQGGAFKLSNYTGMRYISMNELYGVKSIIGKGSKLSFWARGAYTDGNFNTNHGSDTPLKVYAFYDSPLTPSTQSTCREELQVTVQKGSEWQHFEMSLTEGRQYYGFGLYAKQTSGSTQYLPIDDIQIYTASPYAEYVAPVAVTGVEVAPTQLDLTVGGQSQLTATVAPADATNKAVSWSSDNACVTVDNDGTVHAVSVGSATVTATTSDGGFTATCAVTVSPVLLNYPEGTFKAVVSTYTLTIAIGNETNGLVAVKISTADAVATGITYNKDTKAFTITTTGSVGGYTVGDITGFYDPDHDQLTGVGCSGQIGAVLTNVTLTRPEVLYNFNDDTTTLQSQYKRRFREKGEWKVDSTNTDRIVAASNMASGSAGLTVRPCTKNYQGYCLNLQNDYAEAKTLNTIQFWVYNPCDYDISFRIYYFKSKGLTNNGQVGLGSSDKAKAHSWTYIARGFTQSAIYNFSISVWTEDQTQTDTTMSAKLVFDDLLFY